MAKHPTLQDSSRRRFFRAAGTGLGAAMIVGALPRLAHADDLPHLSPTDPTAQALNYNEDASKVDKAKATTFVAGSLCSNCTFFHGGSTGYGACDLFPGKATNAKGWCAGYAKKS